MSAKLLTEHNLEFLCLKGGYTGSSESTLVKMPHCWKSHVTAQITATYIHSIGQRDVIPPLISCSEIKYVLIVYPLEAKNVNNAPKN